MNSTLKNLKAEGRCFLDEPLANHTTWGVGGKAKIFVIPKTLEQLIEIVAFCDEQNIKFKTIGFGSNLLFLDSGFDGIVISTKNLDHENSVRDNSIVVGAGESLTRLSRLALNNGLTGLEWACGIPGTVGGAITQNAGAFGMDISKVLSKVLVYENRQLLTIKAIDCEFSYRFSRFLNSKSLILDACFTLKQDSKVNIKEKMQLFSSRRLQTQPFERSAGSVFKMTKEGAPAGYLIEEAGLKGKQIGGAKISEKHANFIVNNGGASAVDIINLINLIREEVFKKFNVWLETEIEIVED